MDKVRIVIKYFCKKGMSPKNIHETSLNLGDESPLYSVVKNWAAEFRRGRKCVEVYERS